ncbi:hypothetical protein [Saccharothrix australiensis]|uniref:Uncharacterized protein n=1 Tax=Saccharothrix australiensis TaxID=2072 RepID=A0A495VR13_9PSEU|nr:hypothetical protein [Saccharothrix australiensis]RKT51714.1 hypothetical protein C8E97_0198 [Saccharothrix australiensis]
MTRRDEFLGGLHFDEDRDERVGPRAGVVRYEPVRPPPRRRARPGWHVLGVVVGALGIVVAAFAWGYGLGRLGHVEQVAQFGAALRFDVTRVRGLVALVLAGLVVGLVTVGRLSPAAPLTAGLLSLAAGVAWELGVFPVLPVFRPVFDGGAAVVVGVLLLVIAFRRR